MKLFVLTVLLIGHLILPHVAGTHGTEPHSQPKQVPAEPSMIPTPAEPESNPSPQALSPSEDQKKEPLGTRHTAQAGLNRPFTKADLACHPVVVHFPVALLILGGPLWVAGMLSSRRSVNTIATAIMLLGFIGAAAATYYLHPHTIDLPDHVHAELLTHIDFAYATVYLSLAAVVSGIWATMTQKRRRIWEVVTLIFILASSAMVSATGYYGGTLVYTHGVGPQGRYIEWKSDSETQKNRLNDGREIRAKD
jgi:uncharacterized membrane protein